MNLHGFLPSLIEGAWLTLSVALASMALAMLLGLFGALAKLSRWRLARGLDDPDRLFFDRVLMMEGDTELGLLLKNSLDAMGPLWPAAAPGAH